jgi:C4-dicarboxylate transporter
MLQPAMMLGACGYFEDGLSQEQFIDRLIHLLRSFSITQAVSTHDYIL